MKKIIFLILVLLFACDVNSDTVRKKTNENYNLYRKADYVYIERMNHLILCIDGYKYLSEYNVGIVQMKELDENGKETLCRCENE